MNGFVNELGKKKDELKYAKLEREGWAKNIRP